MKYEDQFKKLVDLTGQMREAQKSYFKTRHKTHLERSKFLEGEVDRLLFEIKSGQIKLL